LNKTAQLALLTLVLAVPASGQQVASVDLTHLTPVAETPKNSEDPKTVGGCEKLTPGIIADGFTESDDKQPRPIRVTFINLSSLKLRTGDELEATVQLLNSGTKGIEIPWSTEWETTIAGQDPSSRSWTVGAFEVHIKGKENRAELKGPQDLYGSQFVAGSSLTLKPGQWITARINFVVDVAHPQYEQLDEGEAKLWVEWFQTTRSRGQKDCQVSQGYFPFKSYQQENPPVSVQVEKNGPDENKNTASKMKSKRPDAP